MDGGVGSVGAGPVASSLSHPIKLKAEIRTKVIRAAYDLLLISMDFGVSILVNNAFNTLMFDIVYKYNVVSM